MDYFKYANIYSWRKQLEKIIYLELLQIFNIYE